MSELLTIVMPAHNAAKYISTTLESFLQQSFSAWKLIVINDASTDNTAAIVQEFAKRDARIQLISNEQNLRVAKTMNKGIALVDTPYFARVDSDDVLLPSHFDKLISFLETHPDISVCGSQVITIDGNGDFRRKWNYETDFNWLKASAIFACPFLQSSVVLRTDAIKNVNGYRPEMELIEDYELWIRLLQEVKAATIPDYTIQYRIHDNNMSETNKQKIFDLLAEMFQSNQSNYPIDVQHLALHARMEFGYWALLSHEDFSALKSWKKNLMHLNQAQHFFENSFYKDVLDKYFTNAYLKIASQNGGILKAKALLTAVTTSPKWFAFIAKRKKENQNLHNL